MKPTVHDIAAYAGVSLATVDRVLNGRAGVRAVTRARVEEAVKALGFVRDLAAANLAKGRIYSFAFILPDNDNSFMRALRSEVEDAAGRGARERMQIRLHAVPAFDPQALTAALEQILAEAPDGVAFVAIDAPQVRNAADRLIEAGIAVVTLVSDLGTAHRRHFAGIDNMAAGRTAGTLISRFIGQRPGPVLALAGSLMVRDHRERLEGFFSVTHSVLGKGRLLPVVEGRDDPAVTERLVQEALARHPDLAGIYSAGAGNRGIIGALDRRLSAAPAGRERPVVILHELTPVTRDALSRDVIDAVLNQDPGHEVRSALRVLKAQVEGAAVIEAQERIRIDIFLKDNLP
ncbi:LacI family DNA-binding transcriptional regulator [Rhizobium sp. SSA_523]|uniref:LacI family DNA-binding transcriptional regulator n=1 Tax=Rhizobium sp. SSA_523 TaxID=2952477 RepID=UPI0020918D70|nr:LacI family DNA-binding transcriptional regulator [Rhizobium sp. SSA_523]MCO5731807.1 LacI family DNA-binding transcriptional regulator [Rhizobium sp. SSA_523]WKC22828.1 LacI family DNA-binding transcriptional regulator [Rhizobium sp. SSA_523]